MSDKTKIEWTDATWNPITGCSIVSAGCTNCYAMKLAGTRLKDHPTRIGLTSPSNAGPVWNGKVRFNESMLDQPLRWKRPRRIFVCAHGDLFHENVPDKWIDRVFAVMALAPRHNFQVLTKRPERMLEYFHTLEYRSHQIAKDLLNYLAEYPDIIGRHITDESYPFKDGQPDDEPRLYQMPLPNVWLGVSVEDQKSADTRIPELLATPAALRWISAEPLLGPVDLTEFAYKIDWVVAGGESGTVARPMNPKWVRELRDQCAAYGLPFLFKQWGNWSPMEDDVPEGFDPLEHQEHLFFNRAADPVEWPECVWHVGKKIAGRKLDGKIHDEFPEVQHDR
jgi:protein gp37